MGLPKPIRLKKKEFSLEEIYTNKNFQKPPEGRLETIFEVPVSCRDGSLSLISQRRFKRLVDFPELGVARKSKKPLVGSCGKPAVGRTRRGGGARGRESPALSSEELDSVLCAKLTQLDSWLAFDEGVLA
nr:protein PRR14L-like [Paramormyrops kingsleyae]